MNIYCITREREWEIIAYFWCSMWLYSCVLQRSIDRQKRNTQNMGMPQNMKPSYPCKLRIKPPKKVFHCFSKYNYQRFSLTSSPLWVIRISPGRWKLSMADLSADTEDHTLAIWMYGQNYFEVGFLWTRYNVCCFCLLCLCSSTTHVKFVRHFYWPSSVLF